MWEFMGMLTCSLLFRWLLGLCISVLTLHELLAHRRTSREKVLHQLLQLPGCVVQVQILRLRRRLG